MITKDSKISEVIKQNKKALDAIVSVNKNFKKLKNPVLRKVLASRVSIKDAAKIGDTTINEILRKLESIGCSVEYVQEADIQINKAKTKYMNKDTVTKLDVRPILEKGSDPFQTIENTLKKINNNETLLIVNSFEPIPLINKLEKDGYYCEVERINNNTIHTYISGSQKENKQELIQAKTETEVSFEELLERFENKMIETDVRDLEMPLPMVTILEKIEEIKSDEALFVHHKRLPQYLLPELENRAWSYSKKEIDENNMKFIIYKK